MVKRVVYSIGGIIFIFAVWFIFYLAVKNQVLIPSPLNSVKEAFFLFTKGHFYKVLFSTLLRVVIAFFISLVLAVLTAIISYKVKGFALFFSSVIAVLRALPTLAIMLILLVLVNRVTAPIIVCFLTLFPLLYTSVYSSLEGVSGEVVEMLNVYKVPLKKRVFGVYIPTVLPKCCLYFSTAFSFGIKVMVSAEILANLYGSLGGFMSEASLYDKTPLLFALAFIVCVIGIIIEFIGKFAFDVLRKRGL